MSTLLRVGLVGAGMVSQYHVAGWQSCSEAELIAIADTDQIKAKDRATAVPGALVFSSLAEMIAGCDLDAVDIVTPAITHAALIAEAQTAGLHVICQKPIAPDAQQGRAIEAALSTKTRVMVHENWRWRAPYRALRVLLDTGEIARPENFELRVESSGLLLDADTRYPALVRQPYFATMPRLLVHELLVHHLDTLSYLFGDLRVQGATLSRRCPAVIGEDRAEIQLTAGDIPGRLVADFCVPGAPTMPEDALHLSGNQIAVLQGWSLHVPGRTVRTWDAAVAYQDSYSATIARFVADIAMGRDFETPVSVACEVLEIIEQVYA